MQAPETIKNASTIALQALIWALAEPARADRLLAVTGLTPAWLRDGANNPRVQAAVLAFIEAHEPDLIACADSIGSRPDELVAARAELER